MASIGELGFLGFPTALTDESGPVFLTAGVHGTARAECLPASGSREAGTRQPEAAQVTCPPREPGLPGLSWIFRGLSISLALSKRAASVRVRWEKNLEARPGFPRSSRHVPVCLAPLLILLCILQHCTVRNRIRDDSNWLSL